MIEKLKWFFKNIFSKKKENTMPTCSPDKDVIERAVELIRESGDIEAEEEGDSLSDEYINEKWKEVKEED